MIVLFFFIFEFLMDWKDIAVGLIMAVNFSGKWFGILKIVFCGSIIYLVNFLLICVLIVFKVMKCLVLVFEGFLSIIG